MHAHIISIEQKVIATTDEAITIKTKSSKKAGNLNC